MSTYNTCFPGEVRKMSGYLLLTGAIQYITGSYWLSLIFLCYALQVRVAMTTTSTAYTGLVLANALRTRHICLRTAKEAVEVVEGGFLDSTTPIYGIYPIYSDCYVSYFCPFWVT